MNVKQFQNILHRYALKQNLWVPTKRTSHTFACPYKFNPTPTKKAQSQPSDPVLITYYLFCDRSSKGINTNSFGTSCPSPYRHMPCRGSWDQGHSILWCWTSGWVPPDRHFWSADRSLRSMPHPLVYHGLYFLWSGASVWLGGLLRIGFSIWSRLSR